MEEMDHTIHQFSNSWGEFVDVSFSSITEFAFLIKFSSAKMIKIKLKALKLSVQANILYKNSISISYSINKISSFQKGNSDIAIVFGAEGKGIRRLTKEHCDMLVSIDGNNNFSSLNVSTAVGITLFNMHSN